MHFYMLPGPPCVYDAQWKWQLTLGAYVINGRPLCAIILTISEEVSIEILLQLRLLMLSIIGRQLRL